MRWGGLPGIPSPWGWAMLAAVGLIALIVVGHGFGFRWDPFGLGARRLAAAEARAEAARADADARRLEAKGEAEAARRLDVHNQTRLDLERATVRAEGQARSAPDAQTPLDPDRVARLVGHDRELCRLSPAVCTAAPPGPAPGGDDAVRP